MRGEYEVTVIGASWDETDADLDVHIRFATGEAFVGTFFTRRSIERIMTQVLPANGECAGGKYFWSTDMVIVDRLNRETIEKTVNDLSETEMLAVALQRLDLQPDYEPSPSLPPDVADVWTATTDPTA